MKNLNKLLLIGILAISILFVGCSMPWSKTEGDSNGFSIGGGSSSSSSSTGGVKLEFDENNPPSEMIKGNPYTFAFIFKNYQEHEVKDLVLKTQGFERDFITGLDEEYQLNVIPKATEITGEGVYPGLIVEGVVGDNFEGNYNFNPVFEYAYTALTSYREQICVPDKMNKCDVNIEKSIKQNGPLAIRVDKLNSFEDSIRIDFSVSNSGSGKVVSPEDPFNTKGYANPYKLIGVKLGSSDGDCHHVGVEDYQLIKDRSNFYCTFSRNSDVSYSSQIIVNLEYMYHNELKKKITIKDLNAGY